MDSFIASLPKLPDSSEMSGWDKAAMEFGIPENMLMENASQAIFQALCERFGPVSGKVIWLFMGAGNNGGDAAALARHLKDRGALVTVFSLKPLAGLKGAAAWHAHLAEKDGVRFKLLKDYGGLDFCRDFKEPGSELPDLIVDGLLGTGFSRELKPDMAVLIESINALACLKPTPVLAIDIPSGLDSKSGRPQPLAIRANLTVTLAAAKPGLLRPEAREYAGDVICRPIGMPSCLDYPAAMRLLAGEALRFLPRLPSSSYKNCYGHIYVIGGVKEYAGACHLACAAALRQGAGLVTACAPLASLDQIRLSWPEIMTMALAPGADWPQQLSPDFTQALVRAQALVIGPGMGRSESAAAFLRALLHTGARPPAVIDADALFLLGQDRSLYSALTSRDVLTPHPGEAGTLLGQTGAVIQADRPEALARLCELSVAAVVLKGAGTLLGQKGETILLSPYDIPDLAIGGAGDVLSGCIGAILGSRQYASLGALAKAALGVATHAMAALRLAREYPARGFTAGQLADSLPFAAEFVESCKKPFKGLMPWPQY